MKFVLLVKISRFKKMTKNDLQPLFDLIPEIENTTQFGKMGGGKDENGVFLMPFWIENPVVSEFRALAHELLVIKDFDWQSWDEGREMLNNPYFDFNTVDLETKRRLITLLVRSDRFNEGTLISAFESGVILNILKAMEYIH
jgi:hypothetical protein